MKIMVLGEIKQFPIFEMTCQNTKQWGRNYVLFICIHTMVFINSRVFREETSPLHLQYPSVSPWNPALGLH